MLYLQRDYREAQIYLMRFQQCMTRAMTLIKMYFVSALRTLSAEVQKKMTEKVSLRPAFDNLDNLYSLREFPGCIFHNPNASLVFQVSIRLQTTCTFTF